MGKDFVKPVAKALAENQSIQEIGRQQLVEIEEEKGRLAQQAIAIKTLMALYAKVVPSAKARAAGTVTITAVAPPPEPTSGGLTDAQRLKIMDLALDAYQHGQEPTPDDVLEMLAAQGEKLAVQHPRSVVGTFLYRAKQRVAKANGNGAAHGQERK